MNRWWLLLGAILIVTAFLALNNGAYDGFFQDDELDNISWTPHVPVQDYVKAIATPLFSPENFRPAGHAYFGLMAAYFGLNFPPYMTPIFAIHLINGLLIFLLLRKLKIDQPVALLSTGFFVLSASAFDAYWKPMYVFDLLCATFSLFSLLCYLKRWFIAAFVAFWLAYKAKELAVMLPAVFFLCEYWRGDRRYLRLIPFLLASLSFGVQGIVRNPNHNNDYSFHFTAASLKQTVPFYTQRFLFFPFSGLGLFLLALIRDRRLWLGLSAMVLASVPLLFLPGRLYEAYTYLPLAFGTLALAAAATHIQLKWALLLFVLWLPWNLRQERRETRAKLALDDEAYPFVESILAWAPKHPEIETLVYNGSPSGYHHWGVTAAWNLAHGKLGLKALFLDWPDAQAAMKEKAVGFGRWNTARNTLEISIHEP